VSTRSCIARIKGDGFEGVYHHWDGYPSALGATLYSLYKSRIFGGLRDMLSMLIDEHPAGWSTINDVNWNMEPDYSNSERERPNCFCHGERSESSQVITQDDDMGMEWAYVFDEHTHTMTVLERIRPEGNHAVGLFGTLGTNANGKREDAWAIRRVIGLDDEPEPNWEEVG